MSLALAKRFVSEHPALKRAIVRALRWAPGFDTWLRQRVNRVEHMPSTLEADAAHLPREARLAFERLNLARRRDRRE